MNFKTIDPKTSKEWVDKNEAVIIDVREPGEYQTVHIKGATLLPLGSIQPGQLEQFKDKKIIIHCKLGGRGRSACEKLIAANPQLQLYNLEGGITAWEAANLPVEKSHT